MASFRILTVIDNRILGPYTLIRIRDSDIHRKAKCGQFVMVGFPCSLDPFLLRPLSFLSFEKNSFTILVKTRGRGTNKLTKVKKGEKLKVLGPLGNAINPSKSGVLIAGGIGIAPLYYHSQWMKRGVLFYGEKRAKDLVLRKEFENREFIVNTISEDREGTVTDLVRKNLSLLKGHKIFICGPESMIKNLNNILGDHAKEAFVYMERRMGCGLGGCKSCVVKVHSGYKLVCQEGPIFPLLEVKFD